MGKKGMSKEEKLSTILSIYQNKKQPFNLKEIEKEGSSAGVVSQAIKDVNKELVDDSLVSTDKIGSGVFFWSFPSATLHKKNLEVTSLDTTIKRKSVALGEINASLEEAKKGRNGSGRDEKIRRLCELTEMEGVLRRQLEANKMNDPEQVAMMEMQAKLCMEGANRWVDNTWAVKSFLTKKKGMSSKEADKILSIKEDFDYLDENSVMK